MALLSASWQRCRTIIRFKNKNIRFLLLHILVVNPRHTPDRPSLHMSSVQVNHFLPDKIMVYRDGVSEGQLRFVEQYEIPQLIKCFGTFPSYAPKLAFIVVQKRINTTLYSCMTNHFGTPPPGTVLDHTLTLRNWLVLVCSDEAS